MSIAPAGAELWLDGGHNAEGGRAIAAALGDLEERVSRPLILVVGMLSTKDRSAFLRNFTGLVRRVFGVPIHQDKGVPVDEIAAAARAAGMPAETSESIEQALAAIGRLGFDPPPRILITGSLYLAGEVLAANGTRARIGAQMAGLSAGHARNSILHRGPTSRSDVTRICRSTARGPAWSSARAGAQPVRRS